MASKNLYVKNLTSETLTITIAADNNQSSKVLVIPATWIPIDVTTQHVYAKVENSPDFKRAERNKLIQRISDEDAEALLATPDGQQEFERISAPKNFLGNDVPTDNFTEVNTTSTATDSEVMMSRVMSKPNATAQVSEFRLLVNSEKMTTPAALSIAQAASEAGNTTLFNVVEEYIQQQRENKKK